MPNPKTRETFSSFDRPTSRKEPELIPAGEINFNQAELTQALDVYQELANRTVIRASSLPSVRISLRNQTPWTRREALQALDTVLAENGITMIVMGSKFMMAVASSQASSEAAPVVELPPEQLPDSSSYMLYIVELKHSKATEVVSAIQPFASRIPSSIIALKNQNLLILRDYSANIRRMLGVIARLEGK